MEAYHIRDSSGVGGHAICHPICRSSLDTRESRSGFHFIVFLLCEKSNLCCNNTHVWSWRGIKQHTVLLLTDKTEQSVDNDRLASW